jgi:rhamnose transport system permease protein
LIGSLVGVALLGSIGPALVFLGANLPAGMEWLGKPQWEKAIQGLIILLAVASDAFYREGR